MKVSVEFSETSSAIWSLWSSQMLVGRQYPEYDLWLPIPQLHSCSYSCQGAPMFFLSFKSYLSFKVNESHRLKERFRISALWTLTALTLTSFENVESRQMVLLILHVIRSQRQNMLPSFSVSSREHVKEIATSKLST